MENDSIYNHIADSINSAVSRRKFMQLSGIGAGSILGGSLLAHLQAMAAPPIAPDEGVLVMIYLAGGCDPLNVFTPYTNNTYLSARPNLSLSPDKTGNRGLIPVSSSYGFHSSLPTIAQMYTEGRAAILPGIGFAGQDLSHFSSIANYMRGSTASGSATSGWIGRYLDTLSSPAENSTRGITINGSMPLTLQGNVSSPISLPTKISDAYASGTNTLTTQCLTTTGNFGTYQSALSNTISKNLKSTVELPGVYGSSYPADTTVANVSNVEKHMAITAGVINANLGARIIHITLGGFDTHVNQLVNQATQLAALDAAIKRFFTDLSPTYADRVTVMTYSEFGRRLQENGDGTDHGRAAFMMLLGNKVNGGQVLTPLPDLSKTDSAGNLIDTTDFRQVYSEIATNWLKTDPGLIIGTNSFAGISAFNSGPGTTTTSSSTSTSTSTSPSTSSSTTSSTTTTQPPTTTMPSTTTTTTKPTTTTTTTMPPTTTTTTMPPTTTTTTRPPTTTTTIPVTTTTQPVTTTTQPVTTTTKPLSRKEWARLIRLLRRRRRRRR
ncbi:MAG: DUF1501 domain-containing protein [Acidimicrobiia bacterium]